MNSKKYLTMLPPIILLFLLLGFAAEDRLIKLEGIDPSIKIGSLNIMHLICKNITSYYTPLGYYQYNILSHDFIDSISVIDSLHKIPNNAIIALHKNYILIGYSENLPTVMEGYIYAKVIELNTLELSNTFTIRDDDGHRWICGNIACDDTMFFVVWNDDHGGILGQFISCSLVEEGDTILISDADYEPFAASVDYCSKSRHFITVWTDGRTGFSRLFGRIFNRDRSVWGATLNLSDSSLGVQERIGYPHVLWNTDSTFTVFYETDHKNIYRQTFNEQGNPVNSLRQLNAQGFETDGFAAARDSLGRMVVAWEDLTTDKILCQRLNANGSLLDSNFVVTTGIYHIPNEGLSVDFKDGLVCVVWNDADYRLWLQVFDFEHPEPIAPEKSPITPQDFQLAGNYPNPFNVMTKIRFYLPQAGQVELKVWDCLGQLVSEIDFPAFRSGWHEIEFKADNLPSGVYLYEVSLGKNARRAKMVLMK